MKGFSHFVISKLNVSFSPQVARTRFHLKSKWIKIALDNKLLKSYRSPAVSSVECAGFRPGHSDMIWTISNFYRSKWEYTLTACIQRNASWSKKIFAIFEILSHCKDSIIFHVVRPNRSGRETIVNLYDPTGSSHLGGYWWAKIHGLNVPRFNLLLRPPVSSWRLLCLDKTWLSMPMNNWNVRDCRQSSSQACTKNPITLFSRASLITLCEHCATNIQWSFDRDFT